jgi:hypothetical protein
MRRGSTRRGSSTIITLFVIDNLRGPLVDGATGQANPKQKIILYFQYYYVFGRFWVDLVDEDDNT